MLHVKVEDDSIGKDCGKICKEAMKEREGGREGGVMCTKQYRNVCS